MIEIRGNFEVYQDGLRIEPKELEGKVFEVKESCFGDVIKLGDEFRWSRIDCPECGVEVQFNIGDIWW